MNEKKRHCHCGKEAIDVAKTGGVGSAYCRNHLPPHRQRFNAMCFGALLRGTETRKARMAAEKHKLSLDAA